MLAKQVSKIPKKYYEHDIREHTFLTGMPIFEQSAATTACRFRDMPPRTDKTANSPVCRKNHRTSLKSFVITFSGKLNVSRFL